MYLRIGDTILVHELPKFRPFGPMLPRVKQITLTPEVVAFAREQAKASAKPKAATRTETVRLRRGERMVVRG